MRRHSTLAERQAAAHLYMNFGADPLWHGTPVDATNPGSTVGREEVRDIYMTAVSKGGSVPRRSFCSPDMEVWGVGPFVFMTGDTGVGFGVNYRRASFPPGYWPSYAELPAPEESQAAFASFACFGRCVGGYVEVLGSARAGGISAGTGTPLISNGVFLWLHTATCPAPHWYDRYLERHAPG